MNVNDLRRAQKGGKNRRFNERHDKVVKMYVLCHDNDCRQNTSFLSYWELENTHEKSWIPWFLIYET